MAVGRSTAWPDLPALTVGGRRSRYPSFRCWPPVGVGVGARAVVLMRPSLPLALFDLCLIPEHDTPPVRANVVLATRGALNRIQPSSNLESRQGLLLIGGPSAHFGWDDAGLRAQIAAVLAADPSNALDADHLAPHADLFFSRCRLRSGECPADGGSGRGDRPGLAAGATGASRTGLVSADSVSMVWLRP
ncbi:MAG: ELM1/GtrOC1 family putative glycosyltransferase [Candidatus Competibacteraceae bacterium]